MKSRTSFFNPAVLKKDITRFAPVWGLYSVFVGLFVLLLWESEGSAARFVSNTPELLRAMGMVNFFYAPIAAFLLFGDLFVGKMAGALHALPMRREGWFLTHTAAGLLFCLVPNGLAALICAGLLQQYWYFALLWLAIMVLEYLFFFGAAAFSVQCAGNRLGAVAVYAIFNFLAVLAYWLCATFYEPLLYGIRLNEAQWMEWSPVVRLSSSLFLETDYDNFTKITTLKCFFPEDWIYLAVSALVGAALLGLSVILYRKRQLESAGDLIAFRPAGPVFLVIYTLCVGAVLYLIGGGLSYLFLFIGFAIAFFTGRMLMERRVKVFCRKNFRAFALFAVVFLATLGLTALDPMGITGYVPEADRITAVKICNSHYSYDMQTTRNSLTLTDPEGIQTIQTIHRDCIESPATEGLDRTPLYICYELENGKTVERYYYVPSDNPSVNVIRSYFSTTEAVFGGISPEQIQSKLLRLEAYSYDAGAVLAVATQGGELDLGYYKETEKCLAYLTQTPADDTNLSNLFEAIKADCAAGTMAQRGSFHTGDTYGYISLCYQLGNTRHYLDIQIYTDCKSTVAFLKSLQR